jgi:hypothetical protein
MVETAKIVRMLEAPNPRGLSARQMFLENEDLKPVEAERRLWRVSDASDSVRTSTETSLRSIDSKLLFFLDR